MFSKFQLAGSRHIVKLLMLMAIFLTGCSSLPSAGVSNLCTLFDSKRSWFKQARKASDRWGVPVPILMAVIHQESRFDAKARPPRKKILWVFPGKRASSAFGYAQAQTSTWDWYQKALVANVRNVTALKMLWILSVGITTSLID